MRNKVYIVTVDARMLLFVVAMAINTFDMHIFAFGIPV